MVIAVILLTIALIVLTVINLMRARVAEKEVHDLREAMITIERRMSSCEGVIGSLTNAQATNDFRFSEIEKISAESINQCKAAVRQCENYKNYIYRYVGDPDAGE